MRTNSPTLVVLAAILAAALAATTAPTTANAAADNPRSSGFGKATAATGAQPAGRAARSKVRFDISFPTSVHRAPVTGRVFVLISKNGTVEPRFNGDVAMFGADLRAAKPGEPAVIDEATPGFPIRSLSQIPPGDYYVQALLNVYTEFHRADAHVIWAHMDQWEGQDMARSPGNLTSESQKVRLDPDVGYELKLQLSKVNPPFEVPQDTPWVKRVKFESKLLSRFWGHPIYIGATVLLPKGYDAHPDVRYPAIYLQGHFSLSAPFGFTTEPDKPGTKSWDIVCSLPDGEVRVRALENHWVQIGSGRSTF